MMMAKFLVIFYSTISHTQVGKEKNLINSHLGRSYRTNMNDSMQMRQQQQRGSCYYRLPSFYYYFSRLFFFFSRLFKRFFFCFFFRVKEPRDVVAPAAIAEDFGACAFKFTTNFPLREKEERS